MTGENTFSPYARMCIFEPPSTLDMQRGVESVPIRCADFSI